MIEDYLYTPIYLAITSLLAAILAGKLCVSPDDCICTRDRSKNIWICLGLGLGLSIWLGMRPPFSIFFGDSYSYAHMYSLPLDNFQKPSLSSEWLFSWIMYFCKASDLSLHDYFIILDALYIFSGLWAVRIFMPRNPLLGFTFMLCSLMYFSFAVNGLRNGLACHILLLAMALFLRSRYWAAAILALAAFSIHRSTALPIVSIISARWIVTKPKAALIIWIGAICFSLIWGDAFLSLFSSMNFDSRMESYAKLTDTETLFSSTGFRWDFLIYSAMPVLLGYIVLIEKNMQENWYRILFCTYCLANAFWILIIRTAFTNRFAYLSWFMYPIIIAYPLIMMQVWPDQDRKTAAILAAYAGFTLIMNTFYW